MHDFVLHFGRPVSFLIPLTDEAKRYCEAFVDTESAYRKNGCIACQASDRDLVSVTGDVKKRGLSISF